MPEVVLPRADDPDDMLGAAVPRAAVTVEVPGGTKATDARVYMNVVEAVGSQP